MATNGDEKHYRAVIGNASNFWLYSSKTGFDLTHPAKPDSPPITPSVRIETSTKPITVDPAKTALIVIDMQNYFLSPAFGRKRGAGHAASDQLVENAIPGCRKAGIRVVWVNWGLTEKEVDKMPPAAKRPNGFEVIEDDGTGRRINFEDMVDTIGADKQGNPRYVGGDVLLENGKKTSVFKGYGKDLGRVEDPETGEEIEAGPMLMRDAWNSDLCPPLNKIYEEGTKLHSRPDVWIHKNRMSGLWGVGTDLEVFLEKEGLKTLFFTGVNTDQCVSGTFTDAYSKGYDCVLLSDGCGTTSPDGGKGIEWNVANTWGFMATCKQLADGVAGMTK
ncbi:hypothetical protein M409DRAFT_67783 [Zasmidium cellare ATCC 36951]|uniref:Isochorismatase-like domain-containing protein n=1 Tax=Zasmidium cellare ATCC 36951 TaxID=1080233 RepID=A0A6A6CG77_ZASCE|nr:uncharacterized protein M409DRAFT_67783 [Zasmidium cellare ATCC 36951]KAF2164669.1 hypothetical protein M409DRAFT_67783 [Zasmidium cellare ATCC 36951]